MLQTLYLKIEQDHIYGAGLLPVHPLLSCQPVAILKATAICNTCFWEGLPSDDTTDGVEQCPSITPLGLPGIAVVIRN